MNKGLKIPNKLWLKIFIIMISLILFVLLLISCSQNHDFDKMKKYRDDYYYKNKIYGYYGYLLVTKHKNIHRWCEYSVYETMDELNTTEGVRRLIVENPGGYRSLEDEDKNHVDHLKNPLLHYLNKTTGDITPWIKLSDLTPQRLSIESDEYLENAYRAYQICRDFFVDPKPGTYKDLFNFLSTDYFDHIEMSFGEGFTLKGYARQYTKDDFVEVLSASDTLVQYYTDCKEGRVLFLNQRKRLGIELKFSSLDRYFC